MKKDKSQPPAVEPTSDSSDATTGPKYSSRPRKPNSPRNYPNPLPRNKDPEFIQLQHDLKKQTRTYLEAQAAKEAARIEAATGVAAPAISKQQPAPEFRLNAALPNNTAGLCSFYDLMHMDRGFKFPVHLKYIAYALTDLRIPKLLIIIGPGSGKATDPSTPVLTPSGWRRIDSLTVGDYVVCPDGSSQARITGVHRQEPSHLWRVRFADGREIRAHSDHLWKAHHKKFKREHRGEPGADGLLWDVVRTQEIAGRLQSAKDLMWYVPLTEPVHFPEQKNLPVPPYTLGVILGDGHITESGHPVVTNPDIEIRREVENEIADYGFSTSNIKPNSGGCPVWSIRGAGKSLVELGLDWSNT